MIETVEVPTSAADVVAVLGAAGPGDGAVLAGGTLLMPQVNNTATGIRTLVSTRRSGNSAIEVNGTSIRIGAAATLASVEADAGLAFLRPALAVIASPTIRNMATVGGNLFAPSPYGDLATCLIALDAQVELLGQYGTRLVGVDGVIADGVEAGELVTSVQFEHPGTNGWFFTKAMRRKLNSASIVTVAAKLSVVDGAIAAASVGLGGCGPTARRSPAAQVALVGSTLDENNVDAASTAALEDTDFFTDEYASAWYRERVLPVHFRRALLGEDNSNSANNSEGAA